MTEVKVITMTESQLQNILDEHVEKITHLIAGAGVGPTEPKVPKRPNILITKSQACEILKVHRHTFTRKYQCKLNQVIDGSTAKYYLNSVEELALQINNK